MGDANVVDCLGGACRCRGSVLASSGGVVPADHVGFFEGAVMRAPVFVLVVVLMFVWHVVIGDTLTELRESVVLVAVD